MALTVADIYSQANRLKKRVQDFASNPLESLLQTAGYGAQRAQEFKQLNEIALQGDLARAKGMQPTPEQVAAENKVRDIWASAYNPTGITVYHGSPYLFRRFDPSKMGTGEGNQAYGVGAGYTAEARPVAEEYRNQLGTMISVDNKPFYSGFTGKKLGTTGNTDADEYLLANLGNIEKAIKHAKSDMKDVVSYNPAEKTYYEKTISHLENLKSRDAIKTKNTGYLYEGDIPDELLPKFLDWDKPLGQQTPQEVKDSFNSIIKNYPELKESFMKAFRENQPGSHYYSLLNDYAKTGNLAKNQQFASDVLNQAGLRGIRYLDQGSRGAGKGTSNFIPFRAEDFQIKKINDIPLQEWEAKGAFGFESAKDIQSKYPNVALDVSEGKGKLNLYRIVVPKEQRGEGIGSAVMQDLADYADKTGQTVTLSPSTEFGATSVNRLKEFYKQFGFVENKGRNKDFSISETMYRVPKE